MFSTPQSPEEGDVAIDDIMKVALPRSESLQATLPGHGLNRLILARNSVFVILCQIKVLLITVDY